MKWARCKAKIWLHNNEMLLLLAIDFCLRANQRRVYREFST